MRRAVIFTADDAGLSPAVNRAVVMAHRDGLLTGASLMPGAPAWDDAVAQLREVPELCLGVHLTLVQGRAVRPRADIPHLVDGGGNFRNNPVGAGCYYYFRPAVQAEVRRELGAQIEKVWQAGLRPWFLNGHLNIHLHPRVWPVVRDLAREYDIPAVRLTREPLRVTLRLNGRRLVYKTVHALIFAWLARRAAAEMQGAGLKHNDYLFGLLNDGQMDEAFLAGVMEQLKPGVTEIYLHPAAGADDELRRWMPAYRHREELAALLSPRVRAAMAAAGVERTDFRRL